MKKLFITATLVATASIPALAQQSATSPEQQVRQAYASLTTAAMGRDYNTLDRYISNKALFVFGDKVQTKQQMLTEFKALPMSNFKKDPLEKNRRISAVKVNGDNAILIENVWRSDGKKYNSTSIFTSVFAKQGDDWKMLTNTQAVR